MHVDIGRVLHVLAHELRTPSGIAQGYVRMLLEERLSDPADQRRALEQTHKALARVSELTRESAELANWVETDRAGITSIAAGTLIERVVEATAIAPAPNVQIDTATVGVLIETVDENALVNAVSAFVKATARELRTQGCTIDVRAHENRTLDILIGPAEQVASLAAGPHVAGAQSLELERGGLGLSLVTAAVVLEAHNAIGWTPNGSRTTVGMRLPLKEERAHQ